MKPHIVCRGSNDLTRVLDSNGIAYERWEHVDDAVASAEDGSGILVLAEGYPESTTVVSPSAYGRARDRGIRLYVEYPEHVPDVDLGEPRGITWERTVVASEAFAPDLPPMRILMAHGCRFTPASSASPHLVVARVAGFDTAVYGLPDEQWPLLFEHPDEPILVATTALSHFVTGRFAPDDAWAAVWRWILSWTCPGATIPPLVWEPSVRPSFGSSEPLPPAATADAVRRGAAWYPNARLYVHETWRDEAHRRLHDFHDGTGVGPDSEWPVGDGSFGMLEGASSAIHHDGTQAWRYFLRNDCMGETAMAGALAGQVLGLGGSRNVAANLCDFITSEPTISGGPRADTSSPHYGLLNWDTRAEGGVYYGDDNARSLLGMIASASVLGESRWDDRILQTLAANLRTTGPTGFRRNRIDGADLEEHGWRYYRDTEVTSYAPHYQSWLWACYLLAFQHTGYAPFRDLAVEGIRRTMAAYPAEWHWTNGIQQERARMLLPLAWLVRIDDTATHREWLRFMAEELLRAQDETGAIREELGAEGSGAYGPPKTNEEYGTTEATLIHENGDPVADLLYTTNFAFAGLHEAAHATGDTRFSEASDRLADFLVRIQARSSDHPEFDGAWFRAFEYRRWIYWASNADLGWGAWSIESGWTQGWITSVLALRLMNTSLWDITSTSSIGRNADAVIREMITEAR